MYWIYIVHNTVKKKGWHQHSLINNCTAFIRQIQAVSLFLVRVHRVCPCAIWICPPHGLFHSRVFVKGELWESCSLAAVHVIAPTHTRLMWVENVTEWRKVLNQSSSPLLLHSQCVLRTGMVRSVFIWRGLSGGLWAVSFIRIKTAHFLLLLSVILHQKP